MMRTLLALTFLLFASYSFAQIGFTAAAPSYTNDFNTFAGSAGSLPSGITTSINDFEGIGTGTSTGGGYYGFHETGIPADVSLGLLRSSSSTWSYIFTVQNNDPTQEITSITFSYTFEQYRYAGNTTGFLASSTLGDVSALAQPGAATGTNGTPSSIFKTVTLSGLSIAPSGTGTFTFTEENLSGSDNGIAMDDLSIMVTYAPLPVTLTTFSAKRTNNGAMLEWTTASEENNDYFSVEMSRDATRFSESAQIKGNGTTESFEDYSYEYNNLAAGTYYFRLRQVDYDGQFAYSDVVSMTIDGGRDFDLIANVVLDYAQVEVKTPRPVRVLNSTGVVVAEFNLVEGMNTLDVSSLTNGIYILTDGISSKRFVK